MCIQRSPFDPKYSFHPGVSKPLRICIQSYRSSTSLWTGPEEVFCFGKPFCAKNSYILHACHASFLSMKEYFPGVGLHVFFSKSKASFQLITPLRDDGIICIMEVNDYQRIDIVFLLIVRYVNRVTGYKEPKYKDTN